MAKTIDSETTVLAKALRANSFRYEVMDYTRQIYDMLNHKRKTIIDFKDEFYQNHLHKWYSIILNQTNCAAVSYDEYKKYNARYIFIAKK